MSRARHVFAYCLFGFAMLARSASGNPLEIEYSVVAGCPDLERFATEVAFRSESTPLSPVRIRVDVTVSERGFRGSLELPLRDVQAARVIEGTRCLDVIRALAIAAAAELEELATTPEPQLHSNQPPDVEDPPQQSLGASPPAIDRAAPLAVDLGLSIGATAGDVNRGIEFPFAVEVGRDPWAIRVGFRFAQGQAVAKRGNGQAHLDLRAASIGGCAIGVQGRLGACGTIEGGLMRAQGAEVNQPQGVTRPWVSVGTNIHARVAVWKQVRVGFSVGAFVPLVRDAFVFEPMSEVYTVPRVGFHANISLLVGIK